MESQWNNPEFKQMWTCERWFVVSRGDYFYVYERAHNGKAERLRYTERTAYTAAEQFTTLLNTGLKKMVLERAGVDEDDYYTVWAPESTQSLYLMNRQNPIIRKEYEKRTGTYNGTLTEKERYRWELEMADKYMTVTPMPEHLTYRYKTLQILLNKP